MVPMRGFRIVEALQEPPESPQGFGVRWLAGNGADTALEFMARVQAKAVCALALHPLAALSRRRSGPHSKTLARAMRFMEASHELGLGAPASCRRVAAWVRKLAGRDAGAPSFATSSWSQCPLSESWRLPMK